MKMWTDGWTDKWRKNRQTNGQNYTVFELQSGNKNVDKQSDGQTNGQTNRWNFTNFERNLAMMVIYLPVKFEFDWTNRFGVRVQKRKCR